MTHRKATEYRFEYLFGAAPLDTLVWTCLDCEDGTTLEEQWTQPTALEPRYKEVPCYSCDGTQDRTLDECSECGVLLASTQHLGAVRRFYHLYEGWSHIVSCEPVCGACAYEFLMEEIAG